jgi:hypothetical protein
LQISLLTLVLGLAAQALADTRPRWSGVCLGLSLMKPQIAAPFLLWALLTRRWKLVAISALVVAAGTGLFCLRVRTSPFDVAARYLQILKIYYTGDSAMIGESHLRPLVARWVGSQATDGVSAILSLILLGVICVTALTRGRTVSGPMYSAPAMAGAWSLLTFYHLTYGFVLMLPAAALLLLADDAASRRERHAIFWILQLGLTIDVPGVWRRVGTSFPRLGFAGDVFANFDRILVLFLFVAMFALERRAARPQVKLCASSAG